MTKETDTQIRLRRAKEALENARQQEIAAIKTRAIASETVKRAKERYEELFAQEEREECARRKANYLHCAH